MARINVAVLMCTIAAFGTSCIAPAWAQNTNLFPSYQPRMHGQRALAEL